MTKYTLCLSGGAMKCAYVAGVLKVIHDMKINVDSIYSSSGSSLTSPYFVSGQIEDMLFIWRNKLTQKTARFLNIPIKEALFDVNFLVYKVFGKEVPLDIDKVVRSKIKLFFFRL